VLTLKFLQCPVLSFEPYHITATTRRGSESCDPSYVYSRAAVDAGKNHKVRGNESLKFDCLPTWWPKKLERLADEEVDSFMAHPDTLLPMAQIDDPLQRFVAVVKFYLSGWHIRPPYVAQPSLRLCLSIGS
jgi:hypothetical protein